jgi:hypothetical protein
MGFRFHKSIGIIPGLRINLSKTGVSASVGGKGATVNISPKGVTGTAGIPGTGMSYRKSLTPTGLELARRGRWNKWWLLVVVVVAVFGFFYARRALLPKLLETTPAISKVVPGLSAVAGPKTLTVSAPTANCRATPARDGAVQTKLTKGLALDEVERQGNWVHVKSGAVECWVSSRNVKRQ